MGKGRAGVRVRAAFVVAALIFAAGCRPHAVVLRPLATSVQRPSNVAVYVAVSQGETPVPGLTAASFKIYEDGELLAADKSGQVLLDPQVAAEHRTVLLIDVSDGRGADAVASGAAGFIREIRKRQTVTVFTFDGGSSLRFVAEYPTATVPDGPKDMSQLTRAASSDASRNLNGALVEGLAELDRRFGDAKKPVRVGSLVIFTRGADLAGRVNDGQVASALKSTRHRVYAIGVESEKARRKLDDIAPAGVIPAASLEMANVAFVNAAGLLDRAYEQQYLLAYCSPARGGVRDLRVEVSLLDEKGKERSGKLETAFDSTGFVGGCDPKLQPRFVVTLKPGDKGVVAGIAPEPAVPAEQASESEPSTDATSSAGATPPRSAAKPRPAGKARPRKPTKRPAAPAKPDKPAKPAAPPPPETPPPSKAPEWEP
jgi:hypothetical protein